MTMVIGGIKIAGSLVFPKACSLSIPVFSGLPNSLQSKHLQPFTACFLVALKSVGCGGIIFPFQTSKVTLLVSFSGH